MDSNGQLRENFNNKRDDFNLPIVAKLTITCVCSNIPAVPVYGVL